LIIENGIRPVCDVLNSFNGVKTLWSCEGHPERPVPPYVSFESSQEFAFRVHCLLGSGNANGKLKYCWWITAHFNDHGRLTYKIGSNDFRILEERKFFWFRLQWSKAEMNTELLMLASLLKSI